MDCHEKLNSKGAMSNHRRIKHGDQRQEPYYATSTVCPGCGSDRRTRSRLVTHLQNSPQCLFTAIATGAAKLTEAEREELNNQEITKDYLPKNASKTDVRLSLAPTKPNWKRLVQGPLPQPGTIELGRKEPRY